MRKLTLTLASLQSQEQQCQEEEAAGKKDSKGRPLLCRGQRCGRGSVVGIILSLHVQRLPRQEGQGARAPAFKRPWSRSSHQLFSCSHPGTSTRWRWGLLGGRLCVTPHRILYLFPPQDHLFSHGSAREI